MAGLLDPGRTVEILHGYYDCNRVMRGDIVVFEHADGPNSRGYWIKTAQGLPGDRIDLGPVDTRGRLLLVNGEPVLNPMGKRYRVDKVGASYIRLAAQRQMRNGKIPRGHYLMLGTARVGGWDSRRVGLIPHMRLMGKATIVE